jgi:hypothetical protein
MRRASRRAQLTVAALTIWASFAGGSVLWAQQNQPIYPAYDGFLKNPDGSYTLSFAYFSHNAAPVTVPAGDANSFSPGARDRQQPTTFLPGHWRFQCVMVVGPEFDGKLVWTLSYGGATTGTSQRMLQSNWNLVEGAQDLAKIDYAKAPRGVCLNRAPVTRVLGASRGSGPALTTTVGAPLSLFGSVHDEGLPRGKTLTTTWKQLSGPAPATFENAANARTRATFSAPGTYELELTGNDSELSSSARIRVTVAP